MSQTQSTPVVSIATVEQLVSKWGAAQLAGDAGTLEQMTIDDFTVIGPRGFILGKQEWLAGFKTGDLKFESLDWGESKVRMWVMVNDNTTPLRPVADVVRADPVRVYGLALVGVLDE